MGGRTYRASGRMRVREGLTVATGRRDRIGRDFEVRSVDDDGGAPSVACPAGTVGIGTTALTFGLGGSHWRAAHWGWMPARE